MTTLQEAGQLQTATDDRLAELARGARGGGVAADGSRSLPDLARLEIERRKMARAQEARYAKRREERSAARTAPPPDPLARLVLHGTELNDQDLRALRRFIEGTVRDLFRRLSFADATVEFEYYGEEADDGH